ncbi:MAG: thioredoxin family protein [Pirellula sp.]
MTILREMIFDDIATSTKVVGQERTNPIELRIKKQFLAGLIVFSLLLGCGLAFAQVPSPTTLVPREDNKAPSGKSSDQKEEDRARQKLGKPNAAPFTIAGKVLNATGEPTAGAKVHFVSWTDEVDAIATADDTGAFRIQLRVDENKVHSLRISASSSDGSSKGFYRDPQTEKVTSQDAIEVRLEAAKSARIKVVHENGKPIQDAKVAIQLNYPITIGPTSTDASGMAIIQLPETESIQSVVAWKDHKGLDYKVYKVPRDQAGDHLARKPQFPMESVEILSLNGASPLSIHITDEEKQPISDVQSYVWLLRKNERDEQMNLSYFADCFMSSTDSSGTVAFNWFPVWQTEVTTVWPNAKGFVHSRGNYDPETHTGKLHMQLERLIPIRGTVTFPDGKPATGIAIAASGAGYSMDGFRGESKTDDLGRYEIMAAPNQIYLLYVVDEKWSAPSQSGFAVMPDKEVDEHDFVLSRATRVFGQVLNKATGEPVIEKFIYLTHHGIDLSKMGKGTLPNPEKSNRWVSPMRQLNATSGEDGGFEFFVGDGNYNLFVQGMDAEKFTIDGEKEKRVNLRIEVYSKSLFTGTVFDDETNEPIDGACVQAVSRNFQQHNDWQASTTTEGKFQVSRFSERTFLHVTNTDATLGAISEIEAESTAVVLRLSKLGSATGRLMTEDGSKPSAGVKLIYGVKIQDDHKRFSTSRFGKVVTTDSKGEFLLPNLVSGWDYECTLFEHPGGYVLKVANVMVQAGQKLDLGELKTPTAPKPYVPPTLEEQIKSAFEVSGTPLERYEKAKQLVQNVNQNLLIVFAEPKDPRVHTLMQIRFEDQDFGPYRDDFRFMAIPTDNERFEPAKSLATALELPSLKQNGEFLLVVMDYAGKMVAKIDAGQICVDTHLSKPRLFAELDKYKTTPLDGRDLLEKAIATATRENKRVLVQETATWCGPCHMLSRLLLANRQWEKDYVWVKMDHRWTGAIEIMRGLREGANGGIPWFVILDASGKKLATSNLPDSGNNIGFPSEDYGREHFANMLKATRQRMTDQEIEELVAAAAIQK